MWLNRLNTTTVQQTTEAKLLSLLSCCSFLLFSTCNDLSLTSLHVSFSLSAFSLSLSLPKAHRAQIIAFQSESIDAFQGPPKMPLVPPLTLSAFLSPGLQDRRYITMRSFRPITLSCHTEPRFPHSLLNTHNTTG